MSGHWDDPLSGYGPPAINHKLPFIPNKSLVHYNLRFGYNLDGSPLCHHGTRILESQSKVLQTLNEGTVVTCC